MSDFYGDPVSAKALTECELRAQIAAIRDREQEAIEGSGFGVCVSGPGDAECDGCDHPNLQLYYRLTSHESDEGEYLCAHCVVKKGADESAYAYAVELEIIERNNNNQQGPISWKK